MALSPQLLQFKSSGVYRLEFDKSQTVNIPAETIRLVVGFSKKGPFNTPVFVPDSAFFTEVYGGTDKSLERLGSYFHRSCLTCLERGPILALNLLRTKRTDDATGEADKIEYQAFSTSATYGNPGKKTDVYSDFFNRDKFWFPEAASFIDNITSANTELLQLTNIKQDPISVVVVKSKNAADFNITATDWYGKGNVPDYIVGEDYISDYFVDVYVIKGDWTNYENLAIDPIFGEYFDAVKGIIKGGTKVVPSAANIAKFEEFLNLDAVNHMATYTGTLVPDFVDLSGNNMFIQDLINSETSKTGLFCAIRKEVFDIGKQISGVRTVTGTVDGSSETVSGVDLIGHNLEVYTNNNNTFQNLDFLSYSLPVQDNLFYTPIDLDDTITRIDWSTGNSGLVGVVATTDTLASSIGGYTTAFPDSTVPADYQYGSATVNYTIRLDITHTDFELFGNGKFKANTAGGSGDRTVGTYMLMDKWTGSAWTEEKLVPVVSVVQTSSYVYIGLAVEAAGYIPKTSAATGYDGDLIFHTGLHQASGAGFFDFEGSPTLALGFPNSTNAGFHASVGSTFYRDFKAGVITTGDKVIQNSGSTTQFLKFTDFYADSAKTADGGSGTSVLQSGSNASYFNIPTVILSAFSDSTLSTIATILDAATTNYELANGTTHTPATLPVVSLAGSLNTTITAATVVNSTQIEVAATSAATGNLLSVGDSIVAAATGPNGESRLTKIKSITYKTGTSGTKVIKTDFAMKQYVSSGVTTVEAYEPLEDNIKYYKAFALKGFTLGSYHLPNGTQGQQTNILQDTLSGSTALHKALIDKDAITYRYVVDTFGLGIQSQSKYTLTFLAKQRQNVLAILNAPSMRDFTKSTDPSFKDVLGSLSSPFIASGGDLTKNPSLVYGLPSIANGANYGAFYSPYINVRDGGKTISVPPAAYVSNNYIDKYATDLPWSIVAGPKRGIIGGRGVIGLEKNYDRDDRDQLEPFGLNPIVFQRGAGLMIAGNKTAQQSIKSALSSAHVREVLIYIEDGIAEILKAYRFEFNTVQTRLEIKTLSDNFMSQVQADNGVYDFRNVMDSSNNTTDVIDANMGILDTFVEPVKGLEILVHRTTVLKTGAIATGQYV